MKVGDLVKNIKPSQSTSTPDVWKNFVNVRRDECGIIVDENRDAGIANTTLFKVLFENGFVDRWNYQLELVNEDR